MKFEIIIAAVIALTLPSCQSGKEAAKPPVRLGADVQRQAEEILFSLESPVTIELTLGGEGESMAREAQALVDLTASTSSLVTVSNLDITTHPAAMGLGVSHGPVIEMKGSAPGTLRYYGFPERKETRPFFEGILLASGSPVELPPAVESYIAGLKEEVWIRIFTTPE
jgi:hypothetical protein